MPKYLFRHIQTISEIGQIKVYDVSSYGPGLVINTTLAPIEGLKRR